MRNGEGGEQFLRSDLCVPPAPARITARSNQKRVASCFEMHYYDPRGRLMAARESRQLARKRNGAVPTASLQEQAYEAIKRRITTLKYRPGEYLNEASICLELGMGRMPVHQALKRPERPRAWCRYCRVRA